MMEDLLWNQFLENPDEENLIVAIKCTKYGYFYAGSQQYQNQGTQ